MRRNVKKLSLSKETLRLIQNPQEELARVVGGLTATCPESWCDCTWSRNWSCGEIGQGC
jgi:hypothetical protein